MLATLTYNLSHPSALLVAGLCASPILLLIVLAVIEGWRTSRRA